MRHKILIKLKKAQVLEVVNMLELELPENNTKVQMIEAILLLFNPEQRKEKEKLEREERIVREKQEREERMVREKLEVEKLRLQCNERGRKEKKDFNFADNIRLVPKFSPEKVETFFEMFEKVARQRGWDEEHWVALIQSSLTGKAQEAFVMLGMDDSKNYECVRDAVLREYALVPEANRQCFRSDRIQTGQSYAEFARQQALVFERWFKASEAYSYEELKELILLEQFKLSLPKAIQTCLSELDLSSVTKAAEVADRYALIHKNIRSDKCEWQERPGQSRWSGGTEKRPYEKYSGSSLPLVGEPGND